METIYTIGHSTHPIEEFIKMLKARNIARLVDIRTIPKSRHNPQFMQVALKESLNSFGISYEYMKALGGLRSSRKDSINTAWRNKSFRNYADYMQTAEFKEAVEVLMRESTNVITAIMCAEAVPWRCHRSLVGDALIVRGARVVDIMSLTSEKDQTLTSFARVNHEEITYPEE